MDRFSQWQRLKEKLPKNSQNISSHELEAEISSIQYKFLMPIDKVRSHSEYFMLVLKNKRGI